MILVNGVLSMRHAAMQTVSCAAGLVQPSVAHTTSHGFLAVSMGTL